MDRERYLLEEAVLKRKFPAGTYRFFGIGTNAPYLSMPVITQNGKVYTIRMELATFPEEVPPVYVTKMLRTWNGELMDGASHDMHTLSSKNGWTRICHYDSSEWTPRVSLFKVYLKCKLWLDMYEAHLVDHKPISYYLSKTR